MTTKVFCDICGDEIKHMPGYLDNKTVKEGHVGVNGCGEVIIQFSAQFEILPKYNHARALHICRDCRWKVLEEYHRANAKN